MIIFVPVITINTRDSGSWSSICWSSIPSMMPMPTAGNFFLLLVVVISATRTQIRQTPAASPEGQCDDRRHHGGWGFVARLLIDRTGSVACCKGWPQSGTAHAVHPGRLLAQCDQCLGMIADRPSAVTPVANVLLRTGSKMVVIQAVAFPIGPTTTHASTRPTVKRFHYPFETDSITPSKLLFITPSKLKICTAKHIGPPCTLTRPAARGKYRLRIHALTSRNRRKKKL